MAKNESTEQTGSEKGSAGSQESPVPQTGLPETTKPEGDQYVDTNAGPDAKEGTVANESPDPEEAK